MKKIKLWNGYCMDAYVFIDMCSTFIWVVLLIGSAIKLFSEK